jgi:DNA polymerase
MNLITLDFETYYTTKDLGFKTQTTEEYVRDPRFEVIGVAVKVNDEPTQWCSDSLDEIDLWIHQFDWDNSMVVAHNALFDMAILNWHFDIRPKAIADTLSMARAINGIEVGNSLKKLAVHYELGVKGEEVLQAVNLRRRDFTEQQLAEYGAYCINDVDLTYDLFLILLSMFKKVELKLIDLTIRMFTEPTLRLDEDLLHQHLSEVKERKRKLLDECGANIEDLMSNQKFAEVLRGLGVEPPMKISLTTGKEALALAKSDEGALGDRIKDARMRDSNRSRP